MNKIVPYVLSTKEILIKQLFPFIRITIFNGEEPSILLLNIVTNNNYHTYNYFT